MSNQRAACSTAGRVAFNTDLLRQPIAFQDYAVGHELLHLKAANHGRLFKALLSTHISKAEAFAKL